MILSTGGILKFVFDFTTNVAANFVSEELMQKLRKDMSNVITDLVWDEYRTFKNDFPNERQLRQHRTLYEI